MQKPKPGIHSRADGELSASVPTGKNESVKSLFICRALHPSVLGAFCEILQTVKKVFKLSFRQHVAHSLAHSVKINMCTQVPCFCHYGLQLKPINTHDDCRVIGAWTEC